MQAILLQKAERINRIRSRSSNTKLDLMKLYGIFCVVYAHSFFYGFSLCKQLTVSSVYVIQLFIFCSGYFYRADTDVTAFFPYLKKCAKSHLLPYFLWNLVYGLICQLLRVAGVISYGSDFGLYSFFVRPWTDAEQYVFNTPAWFLLSLFFTAMISWGFRHILSRKAPITKTGDYLLLAFFFLAGILSVLVLGEEQTSGIRLGLFRPLVLLPYYQLGIVYKKYWECDSLRKKLLAATALLVIQFILPILNGSPLKTSMFYGYFFGNPLLLVFSSITAVLLVSVICDLIAPFFQRFRCISFLSRSTMYIMLHHLFILFLAQLVLLLLNHFLPLPGFDVGGIRTSIWYSYDFGHNSIRYLYVFAALLIPSLTHWLYEAFLLKLSGKYTASPK